MFENLTSENVVVDAADADLFTKFQHLQTFRYEKRKNADTHCVKCPYSEFFWSAFSHIWTKYGEILRISPYSVLIREDTDQKNSEYGYFSRSDTHSYYGKL